MYTKDRVFIAGITEVLRPYSVLVKIFFFNYRKKNNISIVRTDIHRLSFYPVSWCCPLPFPVSLGPKATDFILAFGGVLVNPHHPHPSPSRNIQFLLVFFFFLTLGSPWDNFYMFAEMLLHLCFCFTSLQLHLHLLYIMAFTCARYHFFVSHKSSSGLTTGDLFSWD